MKMLQSLNAGCNIHDTENRSYTVYNVHYRYRTCVHRIVHELKIYEAKLRAKIYVGLTLMEKYLLFYKMNMSKHL